MKRATIISLLLMLAVGLSAQHAYNTVYIQIYNQITGDLGGKEYSGTTLTVKTIDNFSGIYSIHVSGDGMEASNRNMSKLKFVRTMKEGNTLYYVYINPDQGEWFMTVATTEKLSNMARYGSKALILLAYGGQDASFVLTVL